MPGRPARVRAEALTVECRGTSDTANLLGKASRAPAPHTQQGAATSDYRKANSRLLQPGVPSPP